MPWSSIFGHLPHRMLSNWLKYGVDNLVGVSVNDSLADPIRGEL